jgi:hypothetical protein
MQWFKTSMLAAALVVLPLMAIAQSPMDDKTDMQKLATPTTSGTLRLLPPHTHLTRYYHPPHGQHLDEQPFKKASPKSSLPLMSR